MAQWIDGSSAYAKHGSSSPSVREGGAREVLHSDAERKQTEGERDAGGGAAGTAAQRWSTRYVRGYRRTGRVCATDSPAPVSIGPLYWCARRTEPEGSDELEQEPSGRAEKGAATKIEET